MKQGATFRLPGNRPLNAFINLFLTLCLGQGNVQASEDELGVSPSVLGQVVKFRIAGQRLDIPVGYFWWESLKKGGWSPRKDILDREVISFMATMDDLKPYSEETRDEFEKYKQGKGGRLFGVMISIRARGPTKTIDQYLDDSVRRRRVKSEYSELEKYTWPSNRNVYVLLPDRRNEWLNIVCYPGMDGKKNKSCNTTECRKDYCISYGANQPYLEHWQSTRDAVWALFESFKVND